MTEITLKLVGSACIMAAAVIYGEHKSRALDLRVKQLQLFERSLRLLVAEITYARSVLPQAFRTVGRRIEAPVGRIYLKAADFITAKWENTPGDAWLEAVKVCFSQTSLASSDKEIVESLAISLGVSQQEGQLKQVHLTSRHLSIALEEAEEERGRYGKLWRYLGLVGGAALVILLM